MVGLEKGEWLAIRILSPWLGESQDIEDRVEESIERCKRLKTASRRSGSEDRGSELKG